VEIQGLWGLIFGNGGNGGSQNELYFAAGIPGSGTVEDHGLFGQLAFEVPEPGTGFLLCAGLLGFLAFRKRGALSRRSHAIQPVSAWLPVDAT
jgi:hypothetical protein